MFLTDAPISVPEFLGVTPDPSCGALASFFGIVRNHDHGRPVKKLFYESYEKMAEQELARIVKITREKWPIGEIRVRHRIGWLEVGEVAVAIVVTAPHRDEAFGACREVIELIKKTVPIWKKQIDLDGTGDWVLCRH